MFLFQRNLRLWCIPYEQKDWIYQTGYWVSGTKLSCNMESCPLTLNFDLLKSIICSNDFLNIDYKLVTIKFFSMSEILIRDHPETTERLQVSFYVLVILTISLYFYIIIFNWKIPAIKMVNFFWWYLSVKQGKKLVSEIHVYLTEIKSS